jgi:hypothetical protein
VATGRHIRVCAQGGFLDMEAYTLCTACVLEHLAVNCALFHVSLKASYMEWTTDAW